MRSNFSISNRPALRENGLTYSDPNSARLSPMLVAVGAVAVGSLIGWAAASLRGPHAHHRQTSAEVEAAPAPIDPRVAQAEPVRYDLPTPAVAPPGPSSEAPRAANEPAPPRPTPGEERESLVRELKTSGVEPAPWHRRAENVFQAITLAAHTSEGPSWSKVDCFKRGCMADATYPNQQAFEQFDLTMLKDYQSAFHGWPGPKVRSPPVVQANGQVVATWALLSDEDENQIKP